MNKILPGKINMVQEEYKFDLAETNNKIEWALQFWKSERDAVLTSHLGKCRKCEYSENCKRNKYRNNFLQMELPI
jgi:hypothetical protein